MSSEVDADKVLRSENVSITKVDGNPALEIGDETLELRTTVSVEDEDSAIGTRQVPARAELAHENYSWWELYAEEEGIQVTLEPTVVE